MIQFTKTKDPKNDFDITDVVITVPNPVTLDDLAETFFAFCLAVGYYSPENAMRAFLDENYPLPDNNPQQDDDDDGYLPGSMM
jgi:hypothetical protein